MKRLAPFRAFEHWLLDDEPAVGVVDFNKLGKTLLKRRRVICNTNESTVVVPVIWFDALFNATRYDRDSWWISQFHVIYSAELIFRGQALEYVAITAYNRQHRPYPRGTRMYSARTPAIVEDIRNKAPAVIKTAPCLRR